MVSGTLSALISAGKNLDNVSSVYKSVSNVGGTALDLASITSRINISSFASAINKSVPLVKANSNLIDTAGSVKKFSNAIPASTDDILTSINPSVIKNSGFATAGKQLDALELADARSLKKIDETIDAIKNTGKVGGLNGLARRSDDVLAQSDKIKALSRSLTPINKVDDVGESLKKSKGVLSKVDDVAETSADVAKNSSKKIDDAADAAKTATKSKKSVNFLVKHSGKLNIAILGGYYLGVYASNKIKDLGSGDESDPAEIITDPASDAYPVSKFDEISSSTQDGSGDEVTLLETVQRPEIIFAVLGAIGVVTFL